jgi:hypothetical protein
MCPPTDTLKTQNLFFHSYLSILILSIEGLIWKFKIKTLLTYDTKSVYLLLYVPTYAQSTHTLLFYSYPVYW